MQRGAGPRHHPMAPARVVRRAGLGLLVGLGGAVALDWLELVRAEGHLADGSPRRRAAA